MTGKCVPQKHPPSTRFRIYIPGLIQSWFVKWILVRDKVSKEMFNTSHKLSIILFRIIDVNSQQIKMKLSRLSYLVKINYCFAKLFFQCYSLVFVFYIVYKIQVPNLLKWSKNLLRGSSLCYWSELTFYNAKFSVFLFFYEDE